MPQHIQSTDISIEDLFKSFYAVPPYQREYVWEVGQVEQLLNDIHAEMSDGAADPPEYFIGSIVVCPGQDQVLDLIDGQQRMTTLFVALCAIRDQLRSLGDSSLDAALGDKIASSSVDLAGVATQRFRLELQYKDSGRALVDIAEGNRVGDEKTLSMRNIANAYDVVTKFLRDELSEEAETVCRFYGYLANKVKLIRIQTEDVTKALKIFETINDRGVGLNSMDLLKNLLFMNASPEQFDQLKDIWHELEESLHGMREKPLRFLRYFTFSRYKVSEVLREDGIYGWFAHNEAVVGYGTDPIGFAKELVVAAGAYRNFLREGKDKDGKCNPNLDTMRILGGWAARQHLILLLAGRHLQPKLFDQLVKEVENLFFCYVVTREPTRNFERNFLQWAGEIRGISNDETLEEFVSRRFRKEKADLSARFDDAIGRLDYNSLQQYRLRYVLAKLTQHIDMLAYGENEGTRWLEKYTTSGGYEIEHIFPRQPSGEATNEFGLEEDDDKIPEIVEMLGNLVLLEKSINSSLGNVPYSKKREAYKKSNLLLTRSLAGPPNIGANTQIDKAAAAIEPFPEWDEDAVNKRQRSLVELARAVWDMPDVRSSPAKMGRPSLSEYPVSATAKI